MMRVKVFLTVLLIAGLTLIAGCGQKTVAPGDNSPQQPKIKVLASVYPVYEFVRQVGGDKVEVTMLVPAGAEPHEWEPSAKDLVQVKNSKLFFYHGANLEHWLSKVTAKDVLGNTTAVEVSKDIELREGTAHTHDHDPAEEHKHNANEKQEPEKHQEVDPHVWLDPVLAQKEVNTIAEALAAADPANAVYYRDNATKYNEQLQKLHSEYQDGLKTVQKRIIVTSHAAFGYLGSRYNLEQVAIMGISPDAEPTPEKMADIVRMCRERQVTYLFAESIVSPKVAETLAKEAGAKVLLLHPIDSLTPDEIKQGKDYLTLMRENLANLKLALSSN
ncbi:metal ABC transporter solute-binding protein, Zn/Mn family [Sporomusa rhizae]|uniref:metal ABC transporter solute-binding protein, Zn/Mn family n=1 Tax=Sporomusa rhizae TaxID=357999 RepID=UPI00352B3C20